MAHDAFISHSSKDKTIADAVCATLEGKNIRCWIAPRDVLPGTHYGAALDKAIENSNIFILLISKGSNNSDQVIRELEIAADTGIPIIPIRIEDIEPTEAMRYYVKSLHWLDAMTPPLERHLEKITASVQALLSIETEENIPQITKTIVEVPLKKRLPKPVWASILIGLTALLVSAVWFGLTKLNTTGEILSSIELIKLTLEANSASTLSTFEVAAESMPTASPSTTELSEFFLECGDPEISSIQPPELLEGKMQLYTVVGSGFCSSTEVVLYCLAWVGKSAGIGTADGTPASVSSDGTELTVYIYFDPLPDSQLSVDLGVENPGSQEAILNVKIQRNGD